MYEEKVWKGLKEEICGLQDPGTALIVVYISIILFLLLFAGFESARADLGIDREQARQTVLHTAPEHYLVSQHPRLIAMEPQVEGTVEKSPATSHLKSNISPGKLIAGSIFPRY
jgi:hypothetical protein